MPDITQTLSAPYSSDDIVFWLVNPLDDYDNAVNFLQEAGAEQPCLLDDTNLYGQYPRHDSFAPFPVHVLIDREGVIRYLSFQLEPQAAHAAIEAVLSE